MSTDALPERRPCVACGKPVRTGASLCPHCGARQRPGWGPGRLVALAGAAVTILSLAFGTGKLVGAYGGWSETHRYVGERVVAAQTLSEVRDFASAWNAIEEAQKADPDSARVRAAQVAVATRWLVDGQPVPVAWIGSKSASAPDPATSPGAAAERVLRALVVADAFADDPGNAELLALMGWARFLRSIELLTERRDVAPIFEQALVRDPDSQLANLFLAHWHATIEGDLEAALPHWRRALAAAEDPRRVRRFQIAALGHRAEQRSDDQHGEDDLAGHALLSVLDDMRKGGETFPAELRSRWVVETYFDEREGSEWFSALRSVRPLPDQLATLDWFEEAFAFPRTSIEPIRFQYIRARLLEEMGRHDQALAGYRAADLSHAGERLAGRFDAAIERLTGAPSPDALARDPWRRHEHHLLTREPGDAGFEQAVAAIREHAGLMLEIGDPTLGGRFPPALEAAVATLARWGEQPGRGADERIHARAELRELRVIRGLLRSRTSDHDNALRDLEMVSGDPQTPSEMRAFVLATIAEVYADRARWRDDSQAGEALWWADIQEGFDRLRAAVSAGFADWDWVEARLAPLQDHPEYAAFSIGHGRVPPRDDPER